MYNMFYFWGDVAVVAVFAVLYFYFCKTYDALFNSIKQQKYPIICINDSIDEKKVSDEYISSIEESLIRAFETILPNKSSFEI